MRIIKAAKKTDEYVTTCDNCKSVLGIGKNDITQERRDIYYYCAICGCKNHLQCQEISELFPWKMEETNDKELQSDNSMRINSL